MKAVVSAKWHRSAASATFALLEEVTVARRALSSLVSFCRSKGLVAPQSLYEVVRLSEGWYSTSDTSCSRVTAVELRTVQVTTDFDGFRTASGDSGYSTPETVEIRPVYAAS